MRPFNIGLMRGQPRLGARCGTKHDARLHAGDLVLRRTLFDQLHIAPVGGWLLSAGRAPSALIRGHVAIHRDQCVIDAAPAIGSKRRWGVRMTAPLQHTKDFEAGLRFVFAQPPGHAQPRIGVDQRGAPEGAFLGRFFVAFFCPLWPTYDHKPSNWPRETL